MIIVGIHNTGILSSAAVVVDGELKFGCAEERLDRRKYSKYFPHQAVKACLDAVGAKMSDVDYFAIGWNPAINIASRYRAGFSEWPAYPGARFYTNPNHLLPQIGQDDFLDTEQIFRAADGSEVKIVYVTHHLAHIANAYHLSGFDEAAIFSCDGYGERATTVWGHMRGNDIKILRQIEFPHSIGSLYSTITEFLGFRPDLDEWKVMGATAYGDPAGYYPALHKLIHYEPDGRFELDLAYFQHFNFDTAGMYTHKLIDLLGEPRSSDQPMEQRHYDIAAALQQITEEYLFTAIEWLHRETGSPRLCMTGGVLMNSVFNGKAALESSFKEVYVPHAADDSGNSIGAALWVAQQKGELTPGKPIYNLSYLGRSYTDDQIRDALDRYGLTYTHIPDIGERVACLLAEGKIAGWFQGRMEFGQRALGNRSILADPRDGTMKDKINRAVKYREAFRPFAPSVLEEAMTTYFDTDRLIPVPYMEKVFMIRPAMREKIPAVVHADGSGRLQTINRAQNPQYYDLIKAFERITGVPIVLNTSFNLNGEPVVESPTDAIRTFFSSGMDILAIGHYLLTKS